MPPVNASTGAGAPCKPRTPQAPVRFRHPEHRPDRQGRAPSNEQLNQAVKQIQDVIKQTANSLVVLHRRRPGRSIVRVVDTESKKLIRQIPSEEVLAIAKVLDKLQGLLVKQQA